MCTCTIIQTTPPDLEWFPRLRCMSLNTEETENTEQNEMRELRDQLDQTKNVVKQLSVQLSDLRDKVSACVCACVRVCRVVPTFYMCHALVCKEQQLLCMQVYILCYFSIH